VYLFFFSDHLFDTHSTLLLFHIVWRCFKENIGKHFWRKKETKIETIASAIVLFINAQLPQTGAGAVRYIIQHFLKLDSFVGRSSGFAKYMFSTFTLFLETIKYI
jgi:hypothetical protein